MRGTQCAVDLDSAMKKETKKNTIRRAFIVNENWCTKPKKITTEKTRMILSQTAVTLE